MRTRLEMELESRRLERAVKRYMKMKSRPYDLLRELRGAHQALGWVINNKWMSPARLAILTGSLKRCKWERNENRTR